jgi:HK97 family phage major capsid protein
MKTKITPASIVETLVPSFEAANLKDAALESAVNTLISKSYEVVDDTGNPVEFTFKVQKAVAQTIDTKALEASIDAKLKTAFEAQTKTLEAISKRPSVEVVDPVPHIKMYGGLRNITKTATGGEDPMRTAYRFGMWCLGAMGNEKALTYCKSHSLAHTKIHQENVNNTGGFLVPEEFDTTLISLREKFGVFRANAKIVPMTTETIRIPRRTGGLTAYFVSETSAATESTKGWDQVTLTAKDVAVLSRYTNQLGDDAAINIGDDLAGECAYAFAVKEDQCGFTGDGTSTYGGITGFTNKLLNLSGTIANIAGLYVATGTGYGTSWASTTLSDFNNVVGKLPQYAFVGGNAKWYCSQAFWGSVMQKLALAGGGNQVNQVLNGALAPMFLGFPVVITQAMPTVSAVSQVACLFGDIAMAAKLGSRRETSIQFSTEASVGGQSLWERNEVGIRAIERFDINVHDVGNAASTAGARIAGPVVGLITASS